MATEFKAAIFVNGTLEFSGDESSIAVIFNNLSGINFSTKIAHEIYLSDMRVLFGDSLKTGAAIKMVVGSTILAETTIGSHSAVRLTQSHILAPQTV